MIVTFIIVLWVANYAETLREAGLTPTRQRGLVLELLAGRERPMTARQMHQELGSAGVPIGLTTVYRALHALAGVGLLHAIDLDDETAYRMCGPGGHHHLICRACGLVTEAPPVPELTDWLSRIRSEHGFHPERHRIEIRGICDACLRHVAPRAAGEGS